MGYVETLPSGTFRGVAWNAAAQRRAGSKSFCTWTEADAWWRRREGELDGTYTAAGVEVDRQVRGLPSLAEFVLSYVDTLDVEKSTRARCHSHARAIGARWPGVRVDELTTAQVRAYMSAMRADGLAAGSREGRLVMLRKAMASAIEQRMRLDDPTAGVKAPAPVRKVRPIITDGQLAVVLSRTPAYLRPAVLLAHDSGLRVGEVCGLRWHRVDLLHSQVLVADIIDDTDGSLREYPKGKEALTVPLTPRTRQALTDHLRRWPPSSPTDPVFTAPRSDAHLRPAHVRCQWHQALLAAAIPGPLPRFHDLRHACATKMARAGVPAPVLRQLLRHANLATTQRYIEDANRDELRAWQARALHGIPLATEDVAEARGA